jgi:hypothetical protein
MSIFHWIRPDNIHVCLYGTKASDSNQDDTTDAQKPLLLKITKSLFEFPCVSINDSQRDFIGGKKLSPVSPRFLF